MVNNKINNFFRDLSGHRKVRGSYVIEFALIAPILFFCLFTILELGILFWVNLTMQYAVREGARYAITGRNDLDPNTANQQRYLAVIQKIENSSMGLYAKVSPVITVNNGPSYSTPSMYTSTMFGGPGEVIVLKIDCIWPIIDPLLKPFFTGGQYNFSVAATMLNEAY
jgi:Flp pilus assembly protein TadG